MYKFNDKNNISDSYIVNYKSVYDNKSTRYCEKSEKNKSKKYKKAKHYKKKFKNIFLPPKHMSDVKIKDNLQSHRIGYIFKFIISCFILAVFFVLFSEVISLFERNDIISDLRRYDNFIWPVVMQDPSPFDEENFIDETKAIESALWDLCMEHKNENLRLDEDGRMSFSNQEVNESLKKLFNISINFENLKIKKNSFFEFNNYKKIFLVEPISGVDNYFPRVTKAEKIGNSIILTVEYFLPSDQFSQNMKKEILNKTEKTMIYKLKKDIESKRYYISSVCNS
ncbi:MAG: hypothetical protein Q4B84_04450 [Clostridia bacterium]|nr:hypothetical protein [Clostridia bacterium]